MYEALSYLLPHWGSNLTLLVYEALSYLTLLVYEALSYLLPHWGSNLRCEDP